MIFEEIKWQVTYSCAFTQSCDWPLAPDLIRTSFPKERQTESPSSCVLVLLRSGWTVVVALESGGIRCWWSFSPLPLYLLILVLSISAHILPLRFGIIQTCRKLLFFINLAWTPPCLWCTWICVPHLLCRGGGLLSVRHVHCHPGLPWSCSPSETHPCLKPALCLVPAHAHAVERGWRTTPRQACWLTWGGPRCSPQLQRYFWTRFPRHVWDNSLLPCLLTPSTPPPPSLLLADDTASYFSEKIEAVKKEFPQHSHDHIHPPTCICASPLLLLWMNHLCSELRPAPPRVPKTHPPALFQKTLSVVLRLFIFSPLSAGFSTHIKYTIVILIF